VQLRTARVLAALYFVAMLVFLTWPGMVPFARAEPFVLGFPFSLAWSAFWIAGALAVLWGVEVVERRHRGPEEED
jgi:membrane protein implicated in regulation of membrane protease activity